MLRRPPAEGRPVAEPRRTKMLLAFAVFILPWLTFAEAQQQRQQQHHRQKSSVGHHQPPVANIIESAQSKRHVVLQGHDEETVEEVVEHKSPFEGHRNAGKPAAATLSSASTAEWPTVRRADKNREAVAAVPVHDRGIPRQKRSQSSFNIDPHDASALATLAPEYAVRATKSPRQHSSVLAGAGLSSPQSARSLERWEVEDYVLLATVDGHLYAVSKESGDVRWHLEVEQPTVETIHHRHNSSPFESPESHPLDEYTWAIEPSHTGPVYVWMPSGVGSGLMSTGFTMKELVDDLGPYAVKHPPVVYTGDKKTTMYILDAATGNVDRWFGQGEHQVAPIATCFQPQQFADSDSEECSGTGTIALSRTEYTVNIHRQDDGRPIATLRYSEWGPNSYDNDLHRQHRATQSSRFFTSRHDGRLYALDDGPEAQSFSATFAAPVARVFDVARPLDVPKGSDPELVLLPQPIPPSPDHDSARARSSSIYLNKTEPGSWYALSGTAYPLILDAPPAQVTSRDWSDLAESDLPFKDEALIGTHSLGNIQESRGRGTVQWPSLPSGLPSGLPVETRYDRDDSSIQVSEHEPSPTPANKLRAFPDYAVAWFMELLNNPLVVAFMVIWVCYKLSRSDFMTLIQPWIAPVRPSKTLKQIDDPVPPHDDARVTFLPESEAPVEARTEIRDSTQQDTVLTSEEVVVPVTNAVSERESPELQPEQQAESLPLGESPEKKKKKAHRGTRGGVKHKKAKKQQDATLNGGDKTLDFDPMTHVNQILEAQEPQLNPNVTSLGKPEDIGVGGFEINGLRVNLDEQLGMGSNGTVVFPGTFHGREIAVKRMLHEFNDLATRETDLLLESDNHPNVIQYYAIHRDKTFLYIALERCHASLADIVDRPHMYKDLAQAGERDIPHVLLQIANGVSHLHGLRIVHRDLKPQNILVTMTKDGQPRLVVSDFGLCKKLDGAQSSFGHTATRPAGTSGWRAPELLAEEDARENSTSAVSTHSESSQLVSSDVLPNRRATRAIDIFSLGLVFFYVLTKGSHPFDCGDRYMREVNIRKGQLNLLPLNVLGDFAFEAVDLIRNMLRTDPRKRPSTRDVMAHPFFWDSKKRLTFLCDVSDHFEKEPRDPPSEALAILESYAPRVCRGDFLKVLTKDFVESLGKQRKYTGTRLLDLLRALRNKWNHREDLSDGLKKSVGTSHEDYLGYWSRRFPNLLVTCCQIVYNLELQDAVRFREYFEPMKP